MSQITRFATSSTMRRSFVTAVAVLVGSCVLGGCHASALRGKVIAGDVSFVGVVDATDQRLQNQGIPQATVRATRTRGEQLGIVGRSDKEGGFTLKLPTASWVKEPLAIDVSRDGYMPARSARQVPPDDKRLLVVLKRLPGKPAEEQADQ